MNMGNDTYEILAPVNAPGEVEALLDAGAHWLYGGVLPAEWSRRFPSTVLLNQRTFASAQFPSLTDLGEAVERVRNRGRSFALTLNAPFYMDEQYPQVLDLAGWCVRTGVNALIVADPGLIVRLREGGIDLPLHLSTLGLACNPQSVALYRDLGVSRVILPRFLNLEQIASLIRKVPDMEYEAFVLVGRCPNIEGVCTFVHDSPDQRWPCEWPWKLTRQDGKAVPPALQGHFDGIRTSDRRDGCGLCALPRLVAAGVSTFKVVGRGAPLPRKVALVGQLSRLLAGLPHPPGREWVEDCLGTYRSLFGRGCRPHNCYFPEVRDPE